jgi:hypothetical protein
MFEKRNKLCLRQSAGDSTGPQVDIAADRLGQLRGDNYVAIQELPARLENPEDFAKGLFLVRREVQHAVRDDDVNGLGFDGQRHRVPETHLDVGKAS